MIFYTLYIPAFSYTYVPIHARLFSWGPRACKRACLDVPRTCFPCWGRRHESVIARSDNPCDLSGLATAAAVSWFMQVILRGGMGRGAGECVCVPWGSLGADVRGFEFMLETGLCLGYGLHYCIHYCNMIVHVYCLARVTSFNDLV